MTNQKLDREEIYGEEWRRREREKEKRKEEKKARVEEKPKREGIKEACKPIEIKIPIIELEKSKEEIKEVSVDKEIPKIREEEQKITIPVIQLEKPEIQLNQVELDKTISEIKIKESELKIPLIRLNKLGEVRTVVTSFDGKLHHFPQPMVRPALRVPIYKPPGIATVRQTISFFDERIDEQLSQELTSSVQGKRRDEISTEKPKVQVVVGEGEPSGGYKELEKLPDIANIIFGISNSKISSKGPKVILYKELEKGSTIGSFETICKRIYREQKGGEPGYKPIKQLDDFNIKEIEKWIEAKKTIVTIDLDHDKEKAVKWFCKENLRELIRRATSGDIGFIIFKTRDTKLCEYCEKILSDLKKEIEHPLNMLYAKPKELSFEEIKRISSLVWGSLNIEIESIPPILIEEKGLERPYGNTFDDIFNKFSKSLFDSYLKELDGSVYEKATMRNRGQIEDKEKESDLHFRIKVFLVKYLTKKLQKEGIIPKDLAEDDLFIEIKENIKTEEGEVKPIPDISVDSKIVYEVETLFGEGERSIKKIDETIEKYKGTDFEEINIVLDNLTFILHLKELIKINKLWNKWGKKQEIRKIINFYTLDIQNNKLLSLKEVIKKTKQLEKE